MERTIERRDRPAAPVGALPLPQGWVLPGAFRKDMAMIRNRGTRRAIAVALMAAGAALMLLAPPVWIGAIPLGLGIVLELVGIRLERADRA